MDTFCHHFLLLLFPIQLLLVIVYQPRCICLSIIPTYLNDWIFQFIHNIIIIPQIGMSSIGKFLSIYPSIRISPVHPLKGSQSPLDVLCFWIPYFSKTFTLNISYIPSCFYKLLKLCVRHFVLVNIIGI